MAGRRRRDAMAARRRSGRSPMPSADEVLSARCAFVLSTGRCGTALLTDLLGRSSALEVVHSPRPELEYASAEAHATTADVAALELAFLAARYEALVNASLVGRTYVETNNRITFFGRGIAKLLPNAKFIHLVRHPGAFVRSGIRRGYYEPSAFQPQRLRPRRVAGWATMSRVEKIAFEWQEINAAVEHLKQEITPERVMTLTSERLFEDPDAAPAVFRFLEVADPFATDAEALKARLSEPKNAQSVGKFPVYHQWSEDDRAALRRIATLAAVYGYKL